MSPFFTVRYAGGAYEFTRDPGPDGPRMYISRDPEGASQAFFGTLSQEKTVLPSPAPGERFYFFAETTEGLLTAASRSVEIPGIENFRDLGGYPTLSGKRVRWGLFFRGGPLPGSLKEQARAALNALALKTVVDYRTPEEAQDLPDACPLGAQYWSIPAVPREERFLRFATTDLIDKLRIVHTAQDAQDGFALFKSLYAALPFGSGAFKRMLLMLDDPANLPMMQHCSAGKDRTGVGSALLLLALGVSQEAVMEDYLLTQAFRGEIIGLRLESLAQRGISPEGIGLAKRMMTVSEDLLLSALGAIRGRYADFETFFQEEYGIGPEKLKRWREIYTR